MRIQTNAGAKNNIITHAKERAVRYGGSGGPVGQPPNPGTPQAKPQRIKTGYQPQKLLEEWQTTKNHLELERSPPAKKCLAAKGNMAFHNGEGQQHQSGGEWRRQVKHGQREANARRPTQGRQKDSGRKQEMHGGKTIDQQQQNPARPPGCDRSGDRPGGFGRVQGII